MSEHSESIKRLEQRLSEIEARVKVYKEVIRIGLTALDRRHRKIQAKTLARETEESKAIHEMNQLLIGVKTIKDPKSDE